MSMFMENEERKSERRLIFENTTYKLLPATTDKTFDGVIIDISESGLCLLTTSPLKEDQIIVIGDNRYFLEKSAIVRWIQKIGDMLYKAGLEYKENIISIHRVGVKSAEAVFPAKESPTVNEESAVLTAKNEVPSQLSKEIFSQRKTLPVFVLVILITVITSVYILYKNLLNEPVKQPYTEIRTSKHLENTVKTEISPAQQAPQRILEATQSAPTASPEMETIAKQMYSVQVGAFKNEANANILLRNYKEKGYEVYMGKSTIKDKGIMYKVFIGQFENKKDASQFAKDIRSKENIDVIITYR